jgi:anti-anti-sigma factor
MLLEIEERRIEPDITVVDLTGKLALGREGQRIEPLIEDLIKRDVRKVILDMSKVDYIDSAGIGLLALAAGRLKDSHGQLVVVAPEGRVRQMLDLTRVSSIVTVCATTTEATTSLENKTHPGATA